MVPQRNDMKFILYYITKQGVNSSKRDGFTDWLNTRNISTFTKLL